MDNLPDRSQQPSDNSLYQAVCWYDLSLSIKESDYWFTVHSNGNCTVLFTNSSISLHYCLSDEQFRLLRLFENAYKSHGVLEDLKEALMFDMRNMSRREKVSLLTL